MSINLSNLPGELLLYILDFSNLDSIINLNLTCKKLNQKLQPYLEYYKAIYEEYKNKNLEEVLRICVNNLKLTKVILLSDKVHNFSAPQLFILAFLSFAHAKILLMSRLFQSNLPSSNYSFSRKFIIIELSKANIDYLALVVRQGLIGRVPPDTLVEIAILNIQAAKILLNHIDAYQKFNNEQLIFIAKISPEHAELVVDKHVDKLGVTGLQELFKINTLYTEKIIPILTQFITFMPVKLARLNANAQPHFIKWLTNLIVTYSFYDEVKNPHWQLFREKNPRSSKKIATASSYFEDQKMRDIIINTILYKFLIISHSYAEIILSIEEIDKKLSNKNLERLALKDERYQSLVTNFFAHHSTSLQRSEHMPTTSSIPSMGIKR